MPSVRCNPLAHRGAGAPWCWAAAGRTWPSRWSSSIGSWPAAPSPRTGAYTKVLQDFVKIRCGLRGHVENTRWSGQGPVESDLIWSHLPLAFVMAHSPFCSLSWNNLQCHWLLGLRTVTWLPWRCYDLQQAHYTASMLKSFCLIGSICCGSSPACRFHKTA